MKLIDGDKLEKHLDYLIEQDTKFAKMCDGDDDFNRQRKYCFESNILSYELCKNVINYYLVTDVQLVKQGHWITKAEDYYKAWQDSGRRWEDMPYFVTGLNFACSNCFKQYDVNTEGVEKWNGCPCCLARMGGDDNVYV